MKTRIFKYLNQSYRIKILPNLDVELVDSIKLEKTNLAYIYNELIAVYGISYEEIEEIYHEWLEEKYTILNNEIVDIAYDIAVRTCTTNVSIIMSNHREEIIAALATKYLTYLTPNTNVY